MKGKEGAYPVYPLYNHPSKKNVIVCKTNLSVFLTNFSLSANFVSVPPRTAVVPCRSDVLSPAQNSPSKNVQDVHSLTESLKAGLGIQIIKGKPTVGFMAIGAMS